MSSQRNSSQRYGSGTVSGSLGRGPSGPGGSGSLSRGYGSGLVSLGTTKKPRTATTLPERKLSVPKPVNLPSLRKENAGNDPNTQLVPSSGGGWQKPEQKEDAAQEPAPNLTAGSSWASAPSSSGVPSWQPPQPFPVAAAAVPRGRSLNPHEYPSLSAAATAKPPSTAKQPVPQLPSGGSQGGGNWDEDERKLSSVPPVRSTGESWADSRFEDDDRPAYRPSWETNGRPEWRGPSGSADGPYGRGHGSEEYWNARGQPTPRAGFSPKPPGGYERFREVEDPALFPPPPPPRHQPPPPPPPRSAEASREDAEAEKRAFEEEIDRVIEEERLRKREVSAAARAPPPPEAPEPEEKVEFERVLIRRPPPPPPPPPLSEEQQAAAAEEARQKSVALRKQREAEAEEAERVRKEAAAAKLRALEESIARKEAARREAQEESARLAAAATAPGPDRGKEHSVEKALESAQSAAAEAVATATDSALLSAHRAVAGELAHSASKDSLNGGRVASSIEAEASSSVGQPEAVVDLEHHTGGGEPAGIEVPPPVEQQGPWKHTPAGQPKAIWQRKDKDPPQVQREADLPTPTVSNDSSGAPASSLFASSSGFGPGLVTTSLGIAPPGVGGTPRNVGRQDAGKIARAIGPPPPPPPPTSSGQMSWRAVLGGAEVPDSKPDEPGAVEDAHSRPPEAPGRGRGRGRRSEREQLAREERQSSGGRGERGRGRPERGRGRGRSRQDSGSKEDHPTASTAPPSAPESGPPREEGRRARQRGEGRGRGRADTQVEGRGRGRTPRVAPLSAAPGTPHAAASAPAKSAEEALPPGMSKAPEPPAPHTDASLSIPVSRGVGHLPEPSNAVGWGPKGLASEALQLSQLNLGKPDGLSPNLDPVAPPLGASDSRDRAIDRPIERPKSAAGVVGRPRSATPDSLLPNGIPVLPNDLSLDGPSESGKAPQNAASISFGFNSPQPPSGLAPGPFPGVFFPAQAGSNNPWQPASSSSQQQQQPNLGAAVESFYKAGGPSFAGAFTQALGSQAPSSGLQFGAFGAHTFPQFGQLGTSFGHAPFIHTGKQPDWSIGPISGTPASSGLRPSDSPAGNQASSFARSQAMDAIVPSTNIQKRGTQSAPGPPGLQRQALGAQLFQGAPGLHPPQQHQRPQNQAPPGLHLSGPLPQFGAIARSPRGGQAGGEHGDGLRASAPQPSVGLAQQLPIQGPPPGIGAPPHGHPGASREQAVALPENVFEPSNVRLTETPQQGQPTANGQARRGAEGRGRGPRGGSGGGGRGQGRGRNFGRGPGGRGALPTLPGAQVFSQGTPAHNFAPGLGDANLPGPPQDGAAAVQGEQSGQGPHRREGRGGNRGKSRGRGERGRGRDSKFVYVSQNNGAGGGGQPNASSQ